MKGFLQIYSRAHRYRWLLLVGILSILISTGVNLIAPMFVRELISMIGDGANSISTRRIWVIGAILTGAYAARVLFRFLSAYLGHKAAWSYVRDLRVEMYDHLQGLSIGYYSDKQTGQLMSRVISDTANFEVLIAHAVPETLANIITFAAVATILFMLNPVLALFTCLPIPFILVGWVFFARVLRPTFRQAQRHIGDISANLQDNLSGIKEIQIFNRQQWGSQLVGTSCNRHRDSIIRALRTSAIFHPSLEFVSAIGSVLVIVIGGLMAASGHSDTADIVTFLLYIGMLYTPISGLSRVVEDFQNALAGSDRIFEILDTPSMVTDAPDAVEMETDGDIVFENVSFAYNQAQGVLRGVSFVARRGQTTALVGPTGVGKSTITSLLMRFYDPNAGRISIGGQSIHQVTLRSLRDQMSVVLQDTFLFNGTIADNIAFAREGASVDQIIDAAMRARVHEDILAMPEGYDTMVGERGMRLSGGQKQRISIARALLRDAPILILDEATASVDVETEQKISQALHELSRGRTIIVIAHRLSTIRRADQILVLRDGLISERGTHDQLLALGGLYSQLNFLQTAENT